MPLHSIDVIQRLVSPLAIAVTLPLFASGELTPVVDTVLPMSELVRAHTMVDERAHFGKVILVNDEWCDQPSGND